MAFGPLGDATSITENSKLEIRCYPNPTYNIINIQSSEAQNGFQITLYDLTGRIVKSTFTNNSQTSLNISDLESGIYIAEFEFEGKKTTEKIIKK